MQIRWVVPETTYHISPALQQTKHVPERVQERYAPDKLIPKQRPSSARREQCVFQHLATISAVVLGHPKSHTWLADVQEPVVKAVPNVSASPTCSPSLHTKPFPPHPDGS
jgi:hypothetical protein